MLTYRRIALGAGESPRATERRAAQSGRRNRTTVECAARAVDAARSVAA